MSIQTYIQEAIKLSDYRKLVHKNIENFEKSRYDDWFGGSKIYRVFIPLDFQSQDPIYKEVNRTLKKYGYEIFNWNTGLAKEVSSNKQMRIGKLLQSKDETTVLLKFNERFKGKVGASEDEYLVVISRHPYDIAGQSFDRAWSSCKDLQTGSNSKYICPEIEEGALVAYVIKKSDKESPIPKTVASVSGIPNKIIDLLVSRFSWFKEWVDEQFIRVKQEDEDFGSRSYYAVGRLFLKKESTQERIKEEDFTLYNNVLVKGRIVEKETTISKDPVRNPIARNLIVPIISDDDDNDIMLYRIPTIYGQHVTGFAHTVDKWLEEKQGDYDTDDYYVDTDKIYNNDFSSQIKIDKKKREPLTMILDEQGSAAYYLSDNFEEYQYYNRPQEEDEYEDNIDPTFEISNYDRLLKCGYEIFKENYNSEYWDGRDRLSNFISFFDDDDAGENGLEAINNWIETLNTKFTENYAEDDEDKPDKEDYTNIKDYEYKLEQWGKKTLTDFKTDFEDELAYTEAIIDNVSETKIGGTKLNTNFAWEEFESNIGGFVGGRNNSDEQLEFKLESVLVNGILLTEEEQDDMFKSIFVEVTQDDDLKDDNLFMVNVKYEYIHEIEHRQESIDFVFNPKKLSDENDDQIKLITNHESLEVAMDVIYSDEVYSQIIEQISRMGYKEEVIPSRKLQEDTLKLKKYLKETTQLEQNSLDKPIYPTQEGIDNFWKWFGDSKIKDSKGRPLVVYHGTDKDFNSFDLIKTGNKDQGFLSQGFYFTADSETADAYSEYWEKQIGDDGYTPNTMICYLKIENPYIWTRDESTIGNRKAAINKRKILIAQGYDGVVYHIDDYGYGGPMEFQEIVAFYPEQIKSAIGNNGNFNPLAKNITEELDDTIEQTEPDLNDDSEPNIESPIEQEEIPQQSTCRIYTFDRKIINEQLKLLSQSTYKSLPINTIRELLKTYNIEFENDVKLLGFDGNVDISLTVDECSISNSDLILYWSRNEKDQSFNFNAYLSNK